MATKNPEPVSEKNAAYHDEKAELEPVKPAAGGNVDYTGSVAKTDPREIALVRKIDWRLMVSDEFSKWDGCNEQQLTMHAANPMYNVLPCKSPPIILSSDGAFWRSSCEAHVKLMAMCDKLCRASTQELQPLQLLHHHH